MKREKMKDSNEGGEQEMGGSCDRRSVAALGSDEAGLRAQAAQDAGGNPCGQPTRLSTRSRFERQCRSGE